MTAATLVQYGLAGGVTAITGWWTALSMLAIPGPRTQSTSGPRAAARIAVIVPAHNEEPLIARTVCSLRDSAGGSSSVEIVVVADNCTDGTAVVAESAGATVLVRADASRRGKSFALEFALEHLRNSLVPPDVVAIVDADTVVSLNFFDAISSRFEVGAQVVQVHYAATAGETPVSRLRRLAFGLVHWSRPLGASRLGLPTTLKGNGMAFRWPVIQGGFPGTGITEDAAATLALATAGTVVDFEPQATVWGLMAATYREAAVQDERWEGGRLTMTPGAVATGLRLLKRGHVRAASAAFELASPPLTLVVAASGVSFLLAIAGAGNIAFGSIAAGLTLAYVGVGLAAAHPGREDIAALIHAPRFVIHKLVSYAKLLRGRPAGWERTTR
ncbi:MAG: glycosyltransferase family 2 protein [Dehalococcoidia bacterium]